MQAGSEPGTQSAPARWPFLGRVCQFGPGLFVTAVLVLIASAWMNSVLIGFCGGAMGCLSLFMIAFLIGRGLLFDVQCLEFLVTVVAGTLPLGLTVQVSPPTEMSSTWPVLVAFFFAGELVSATCTLIGLSLARLMQVERTGPRLGLIAMAWIALLGAGCLVVAVLITAGICLEVILRDARSFATYMWMGGCAGIVNWIILLVMERRAAKHRAEEAALLSARLDLPRHAG